MSRYLVERITAAPNIEVRLHSDVVAGRGDGHLEAITLADRDTGAEEDVEAGWLFVFIGAEPRTEWLGEDVARDEHGFVVTGPGADDLRGGISLAAGPGGLTRSRRACRGCSPRATYGWTR